MGSIKIQFVSALSSLNHLLFPAEYFQINIYIRALQSAFEFPDNEQIHARK